MIGFHPEKWVRRGGKCETDDNLERNLQDIAIYACPIGKDKRCDGGPGNHCYYWGCKSIAPWKTGGENDEYLALKRQTPSSSCTVGKCNLIKLTLKQWQNPYKDWEKGKSWTVALNAGEKDPMTDLIIQHSPVILPPKPVGNIYRVSGPQKKKAKRTHNVTLAAPESLIQPYLKTLNAMYTLLNRSDYSVTQGCWMCLSPRPPYYVGVAVDGTYSEVNQDECDWKQQRLSIGDITEKGLCVKNPSVTSSYLDSVCSYQTPTASNEKYLKAGNNAWWACTNGITPCLCMTVLNQELEVFVMVHILPQVTIFGEDQGWEYLAKKTHTREKRHPALIPVLTAAGIAGSAALGTTAKGLQDSNFKTLAQQVKIDLGLLTESVPHLEKQVDSLAEMVLQNRRGLNLGFMKEGGLCAALGEQCCYYANKSGIIRETLATVNKHLQEKYDRLEKREGWSQSMFNWSPWLTTLVSALAGPVNLATSFDFRPMHY
ncbi:endogenous retrovirus group S71 member 1 Env polyprotein-like [Heterocephalus glaber]|uniref:Endogenous retrovirus group S71 member 1 Env polyprotein-like n=1 Tax=Heterocephalus glaber TaxID=10181 RepID=A0AAX6R5Y3_HETGA|nr:endogenous retrovirus group S71 member 1 Env polyprotein-like [Heterocephalus glaber]